ncbi:MULTISPECIES: hypothetical protein [unclassified Mycobacteroides]|uniref:hypothetical protein n=1 Tax=unclassified Mycobacteroides TaxID=2618759 RepID=UPI00193D0F5E|nr:MULTISPECIES: hypothetical protein [unclassified Mycobacteroides]
MVLVGSVVGAVVVGAVVVVGRLVVVCTGRGTVVVVTVGLGAQVYPGGGCGGAGSGRVTS